MAEKFSAKVAKPMVREKLPFTAGSGRSRAQAPRVRESRVLSPSLDICVTHSLCGSRSHRRGGQQPARELEDVVFWIPPGFTTHTHTRLKSRSGTS